MIQSDIGRQQEERKELSSNQEERIVGRKKSDIKKKP
jgi:hypothetical protein